MKWARFAVVIGSLGILVGFCVGVQTPISTTVGGIHYACADVISPSVLVAGAPETALPARVASRCAPLETTAAWLVWGGIALGGLVLLAGWTVLRERDPDLTRLGGVLPEPLPR